MPSESSSADQRRPPTTTTTKPHSTAPPEPEHLPCPRCDSTNTKFCYYNNYNFSQPRHFCKSCRRYWTHGGTLRDIPIGGGSRKNAKRSRLTTTNNSTSTLEFRHMAPSTATAAATPTILFPFAGEECLVGGVGDSFTSLLNGSLNRNHHHGLFGIGIGVEDGGFGFGRGFWGFNNNNNGDYTWQMESGEAASGNGNGECFSLPDLAISTPGMI